VRVLRRDLDQLLADAQAPSRGEQRTATDEPGTDDGWRDGLVVHLYELRDGLVVRVGVEESVWWGRQPCSPVCRTPRGRRLWQD